MKEVREILRRIDERDGPAVLATVVDVKGSSYRLPGAKMLVFEDGSFVGTVSGGCIEADVLERAKRVLASGVPETFLYDTTDDEMSVFSLNMGCKGVVRILLERVDAGSEYLALFRKSIEEGAAGAVATLLGNAEPGQRIDRCFFDGQGRIVSGAAPDELARLVAEKIDAASRARRPAIVLNEGTDEEYFVEFVSPPVHLRIYGAGADAMPLANIANRLGWRVTVIDHRPAYASRERFPSADEIIVCRPEDLAASALPEPGSAAVVMSHNFGNDGEYLKALLSGEPAYIGLLGPRARRDELLQGIAEAGLDQGEEKMSRLHAPVGLDIGAADPESIAVAVVSEIQAVLSGRAGGFLRGRKGPIYD